MQRPRKARLFCRTNCGFCNFFVGLDTNLIENLQKEFIEFNKKKEEVKLQKDS